MQLSIGQYLDSLEEQIPHELMWPDFYKARRAEGASPGVGGGGDRKSFMSRNITQEANAEWLDPIMKYLEAQKTGRVPPG